MTSLDYFNTSEDQLNSTVNDSEDLRRDTLYVVIPVTIVYLLIFITGILGNTVTCIVIARNKYMHTATNYYLFSLAISDLLLLVTGLPQEIVSIWYNHPYLFGEPFCVLRGLAAEMSANATVLTITAFTAERYIAICYPFLSHTMSKLSRAIKIIVGIWLVALLFAAPHAAQFGVTGEGQYATCQLKRIIFDHSFELSTILFFVVPMTIITVLYALIGLKLRSTTVALKKESVSFYKNDSKSRVRSNRANQVPAPTSRRVVNMLAAVVVAFFICWAPFHVQRLVAIYGINENNIPKDPIMISIYYVVTYISGIFYYLSATINPILYHIMSLKFREAFKETMSRCCRFGEFPRPRSERCYSALSRGPAFGRYSNGHSQSTDNSGHSLQDESSASRALTDNTSHISRFSKRTKISSFSDSAEDFGRSNSFGVRSARFRDQSIRDRWRCNVDCASRLQQPEPEFSLVLRLRPMTPKKRRLDLCGVFGSRRVIKQKARFYIETAAPYEMSLLRGQPVILRCKSPTLPPSSISNSSLRDLDNTAMREELLLYLKEGREGQM